MRTYSRPAASVAAILLLASTFAAIPDAGAYSNQPSLLAGRTDRVGSTGAGCTGGGCHGSGGLTVTISGPRSLNPGERGVYTVSASTGSPNAARMGVAIATDDAGTALSIPFGQPLSVQGGGSELIHDAFLGALPTAASGSASYTFNYTMPPGAAVGFFHSLYATSALGMGNWAPAAHFFVMTPPPAPAAATASGVTDTSVNLSWSGGGPEYRVVSKIGAIPPASPTDGTFADVGANTSTAISGLNSSTQYSFAVFSHHFVTLYSTSAATATATTAVARFASTTRLVSSRNPSAPGESVTFTATVTSALGLPTGTVTFKDGSVPICTSVALSAAQAQCVTSALPTALHLITAEYSGSSSFAASIVWVNQVVSPDAGGTPRLGNISTRGQVLTGNDVMIAGFVIGGSTNKTVVVRVRGPSLVPFGITNALANPTLRLVRSSDQATLVINDDWGTAPNASALAASGFAPSFSLEAAILASFSPGAYTAIVSGVGGGVGVCIVEVFELDHIELPLANISTRGKVLTGNDVMIGGFVINGSSAQTVVVRARGPSLTPFGIANALANPQIQLVRSSDQATLAINDDWGSALNASAISASGFAPSDPLESAILITLPPGGYTAIVSGVGGTTGVGIVEVFAVP